MTQYIKHTIISIFLVFPISVVAESSHLLSHDWYFFDDFESNKDSNFWLGDGAYVDYGITDPTNSSNHVMAMNYVPNSEGDGDSWSEHDFKIPIKAVQIEMGWKMYIPGNYSPIENNHKIFALWSGVYGKANAHISISSEAWGTPYGAQPSVYVGVDGNNYGHAMLSTPTYIWKPQNGRGEWISVKVVVELAKRENGYGRMDLIVNDRMLTSTHHPNLTKPYRGAPTPPNIINYSSSGNYLDQGTILGWANGNIGFTEKTTFLIDDFYIKANSTHKGITWSKTGYHQPSAPSLNID